MKRIALVVLAATQLALLIAWVTASDSQTKASIPAAALSFITALSLIYLSNIEHKRSIRPSSTISIYTLSSLVLDIPQVRTLWLRSSSRVLPVVFTIGMFAKLAVLYLEARSKRRSLVSPYRFFAPEVLVSIYSRVVLWWINPLFLQGHCSIISFDGLFSIDSELGSERNEETFHKLWSKRNSLLGVFLFHPSLTSSRTCVHDETSYPNNGVGCMVNSSWMCSNAPSIRGAQVVTAIIDTTDHLVVE